MDLWTQSIDCRPHFNEPYGLLFLELNSPPYGFFVAIFQQFSVIDDSGRLFYAEQTGFYEDKASISAFTFHGGAYGAVHANPVTLQHCRQYFRGPAGNGGPDRGLSRIPAPEYCPVSFRRRRRGN